MTIVMTLLSRQVIESWRRVVLCFRKEEAGVQLELSLSLHITTRERNSVIGDHAQRNVSVSNETLRLSPEFEKAGLVCVDTDTIDLYLEIRI